MIEMDTQEKFKDYGYNHFFMKDTITTNLRYIVGAFYGTINRHDSNLKLYLEEKEDVLRTLQYYKKDGKVCYTDKCQFAHNEDEYRGTAPYSEIKQIRKLRKLILME